MNNFEAPIYRSLTLPILWMGVPRTVLILEAFVSLLLVFYLHTVVPLVGIGVIHGVCVLQAQKDPMFLDVFLDARHYAKYYYR